MKAWSTRLALILVVMGAFNSRTQAQTKAAEDRPRVRITIDAANVVRSFDPRRLGGTNVALWNDVKHFQSPQIRQWVTDLNPGYIRLPGGSWSNSIYWNGNGVRDVAGNIDPTRVGPDGFPAVDYTGYAPGFAPRMDHDAKVIRPGDGYAGNVDVKTLQDWIASIPGCEPMPCLNAGMGRPIDAAEWVRFSNLTHPEYHARTWEIGNELDGSWEPGYYTLDEKKPITAEVYASRYNAIASAMKAIDPSIRIGGCAFPEAMIREGGKNVDFVSIHTYPGTTSVSFQQNLAELTPLVAKEVSRVRGWIQRYQPEREKQIEIGYTEWNLSGGLNGSDLFSGLWHARFLSEMANNGVDFATQWDLFTHTKGMTSGHALIWTDGDRYVRKAGYYAMWLWNNFTGNRVLGSTVEGANKVYCFASRDDGAVYVQLINPDEDKDAVASMDLQNITLAGQGERVSLTSANYFWDSLKKEPVWSEAPRRELIACGAKFDVVLPPFSVTHLRLPIVNAAVASHTLPTTQPSDAPRTALQFVVPDTVYVGDRVPAYVLATDASNGKPVTAPTASLNADEPTAIDRQALRLSEAAGRFFVTAPKPGPLTLTATAGEVTASKTLTVLPSEPRAIVLWDFRKPEVGDANAFSSELGVRADSSVRANKDVARIDFPAEGITPAEKTRNRALLVIREIPKSVDRSNIRGVVFDVKAEGVTCDDPNASVLVVIQSPADYWMVIGRVPLATIGEWSTKQILTTRQSYIDAMASAYNVWLVLEAAKPVRGSLMFDRVGLMVR